MRGFPQPNPLVVVSQSACLVALVLRILAVVCVAGFVAFIWSAGICVTNSGQGEPPWLSDLWKASLLGLIVTLPLSIAFLWLAKLHTGATSQVVMPVRVVRNEAVLVTVAPSAAQTVAVEVAGTLAGPLSALTTIGAGWRLENPEVQYEYIHKYRLRSDKTHVDRGSVWNVQPGEIIWLVPWGSLRKSTTWSESSGHGSPLCRVSTPVAKWFERAATRAMRIAQRRRRHTQLMNSIRAARKRRKMYGKRA